MHAFFSHLRIFAHRGAIDHGVSLDAGEGTLADGFFTFDTLFLALGRPPGRRYLLPMGAQLLLQKLLHAQPGRLSTMANDARSVAVALRSLFELRTAGVTGAALTTGPGSTRLHELGQLLLAYERELDALMLFDDADRERDAVLRVVNGSMPRMFDDVTQVTVEGGASLFGARLDLLRAFAARGRDVTVRLPFDVARRRAFAWPEASLHRLEASKADRIKIEQDTRVGEGGLAELRRAQFSQDTAQGPVRLVQIESGREHPMAAAEQVEAWVRAGVPLHEICVAVPELDDHGDSIAAELLRRGIPTAFSRGPKASACAAGRLLALALELQEGDFARERLIELVQVLDLTLTQGERTFMPNAVAEYLRRSGYRASYVQALRDALLALGTKEATAPGKEDAKDRALAMAMALEELCKSLALLPKKASLAAYATALQKLWKRLLELWRPLSTRTAFGVAKHDVALFAAEAQAAGAREVIDAWLRDFAQAVALVPGAAQSTWSREDVVELVMWALNEQRVPRGRGHGVAVVSLTQCVEARWRCVMVVGVDPGVLPSTPKPDAFLDDELRVEINKKVGPRLLQYAAATGRDTLVAQAKDTWLWLETLAAAQESLCVSFVRPEGRGLIGASELVRELVRSTGVTVQPFVPPHAARGSATTRVLRQRVGHAQTMGGARVLAPMSDASLQALVGGLLTRDAMAPELVRRLSRLSVRNVELLNEREKQRLSEFYFGRVLSVSALDQLGLCAFRHFAQNVLRLDNESEGSLGADPRDQGTVAHKALELVYADVVARGGLRVARADPTRAIARAREVFTERGDDILQEVVVHPLLRRAALENAWPEVLAQLGKDLRRDDALEPSLLEHRFDDRPERNAKPVLELLEPNGTRRLQIRGAIDRIDKGGEQLLAIDYKRTVKQRTRGRHFQLPIYQAVALRDFGSDVREVSAMWRGLRDGRDLYTRVIEEGRKKSPEWQDPSVMAEELQQDLWARVHRVVEGDVSPDPDPASACKACDFLALCRFDPTGAESSEDGDA